MESPPRAEDFGLQSEWDAAGGGDPAYHREQALESFQQAVLSLLLLAPGLILVSFPSIRWLGVFVLAGLVLFCGFMFFNLVSIGLGEIRRAKRLRDPALAAAAREYQAALACWRQTSPAQPEARPRMTPEQAEAIVREYAALLSTDDDGTRPMLRPASQLPYPKTDIQQAFKVVIPSVDAAHETTLKYAYAALAHFVPDEEFAWVDDAWRRRLDRGKRAPTRDERERERRLEKYEQQRSDEWQKLLKDIYTYAASAR